MSSPLSETAIVREVAKHTAEGVTRRVVSALQRMKGSRLSGDDSGLKNAWDEICVQVQGQQSHSWASYDGTVRSLVRKSLEQLRPYERSAVWLQTVQGQEWDCEEEERRSAHPVSDDDIEDYLTEQIYSRAANWTNARIEAHLTSASE